METSQHENVIKLLFLWQLSATMVAILHWWLESQDSECASCSHSWRGEHNFIYRHGLGKEFNSSSCIINTDAENYNVEWGKLLHVLFFPSLLKSMQKDIGMTSENEAAYFVLTWFVKGMGFALFYCHLERNTLSEFPLRFPEWVMKEKYPGGFEYIPVSSTLQYACIVIPGLEMVRGCSFLRGYWKELITNFLLKCLCCKMIIHLNLTFFSGEGFFWAYPITFFSFTIIVTGKVLTLKHLLWTILL